MATRIFAGSIDLVTVSLNERLQPMLKGQVIDWFSYTKESGSQVEYVWDGPAVVTVWDLIVSAKPNIGSGDDDDGFILTEEEVKGFIADGLEQTTGFVRNKFIKLESLVGRFDFDKHCLVFFFS